jgi:sterol desaturase/sphingolipid hydroxylase (fatty acid hydroxylase superfamily)
MSALGIRKEVPNPPKNGAYAGMHKRKLWYHTAWSPAITAAIYFGELIFAVALAIILLAASKLEYFISILLICSGLLAWTLAEYVIHRFVLHAFAPVQHRIHHARPQAPIDEVFWQMWLAFAVVYLTAGGTVLAGVLIAYAWYLSVHYCAHQNPSILPPSLLKHHLDHHKFANRNYGVTTTLWDGVFRTMLR